jgi:hypothetical protein
LDDLRAQGEAQIPEFLDSLALNERLSASSQRQALNDYRKGSLSPKFFSAAETQLFRTLGNKV